MPRREEAEQQADDQCAARAKSDDAGVESKRHTSRKEAIGDDERGDFEDRHADRRAHDTTEHGEHEAFGEELSDDTPASGAERGPNRELSRANAGASHQQIGHVRTADQKDEADDGKEEDGGEPQLRPDQFVAEWLNADEAFFPGIPKLARQTVRNRIQVRARSIQRHAGLQSSDHAQPSEQPASLLVLRHRDQGPDAVLAKELKGRRYDADHGVRPSIEQNSSAKNRGIASETCSPEGLAQNDNVGIRGFVVRLEQSAEDRPDAEYFEESRRRVLDARECRGAVGPDDAGSAAARRHVDGGHRVERTVLLGPVANVEWGDAAAEVSLMTLGPLLDEHKALGVLETEGAGTAPHPPARTWRCWRRCRAPGSARRRA